MKKILAAAIALSLVVPTLAVGATSLNIEVNPSLATLGCEVKITATLDEPAPEAAKVEVRFPVVMKVPGKIDGGLITVNEMPVDTITVEKNVLTFDIPEPIEDHANPEILIPTACGIANPFEGGSYVIEIDIDGVRQRTKFEVGRILEESPIVVLSPDLAGKPVNLMVQIPASEHLQLVQGDAVKITLPAEFIMPELPDLEYVTLSGETPPVVDMDGNTLTVVVGSDLPINKPITLIFGTEFGLVLPLWPDTYKLNLEIPGKLEETSTDLFQVRPLKPTVYASVDPPEPENKWYTKPPTIELLSEVERDIYYNWNYERKTLYAESFTAPEGVNNLTYVGRIKDGGWEAVLTRTFRVDSNPPIVGDVVRFTNKAELDLIYNIIDVSPCESGIDGYETESLGDNKFRTTLELAPGDNSFVFWAVDSCGRKVETPKTITLDNTPPALDILSPSSGSVICGRIVRINGVTEPGAKITVDGSNIQVDSSGYFIAVVSPTEEGPVNIKVVSQDLAGNTQEAVLPILYISGTSISMTIGKKDAVFAGVEKKLLVAPYKDFDVTYIPAPTLLKALNYELVKEETGDGWMIKDLVGDERMYLSPGDVNIVRQGSSGAFEISLSNAPQLSEDVLCVPLEFTTKILDLNPSEFAGGEIVIKFCPRGE